MKKVLAVALVVITVLGLCACTVKKNEVFVLWSGDQDVAVVPNSLINAMDRALYIERISYKHYAANGDQSAQNVQAQTALNAGCAALMVELVDPADAQTIVDMAKEKNVPVVFFGCDVDEAVVNGYDKCALVTTDAQSQAAIYSRMVYDYVGPILDEQKKAIQKGQEKDGIDKDGDGKITYLALGDIALTKPVPKDEKDKIEYDLEIEFIPVTGTVADLTVQTVEKEKRFGTEEHGRLVTTDGKVIEMILADNDEETLETLVQLQDLGFNTNKLVTHFVPIFTVGDAADYKAKVMPNMPTDKEARKAYLEEIQYLVDMSTLKNKDWKRWEKGKQNNVDSMVYTTLNQISAGRICGSAIENYDALAEAAAKIVASLGKGEALDSNVEKISYTTSVAG